MNFEPFTDGSRRVLVLANREANLLRCPAIGTEHVLLGLLKDRHVGPASKLLNDFGLGPTLVITQINKLLKPAIDTPPSFDRLPRSPEARRLVELANIEAQRLGHKCITPEHLLLGLTLVEQGGAAEVLTCMGVKPRDLWQAMINLVGVQDKTPQVVATPQEAPRDLAWPELMELAQQEARLAGHETVQAEHVLVALMREPSHRATRLLKRAGLSLTGLRRAAREMGARSLKR